MIRKAMEYVQELAKPTVQDIDGQIYSDKSLVRIKHNPKAGSIELSTLSSLVDYIKSNVDKMLGPMIIHVQSPTRVVMFSNLDGDRKRETLVEVRAKLPHFDFNRFIEHEAFCIGLQSKFLPGEDRDLLLKFAGTVESGTVAEYGDDGVTQKAVVKTGMTSKSEAIVPSPAKLAPYRTFVEVPQPSSSFIFRMQDKRGVECALFEADGGAWEAEAMQSIKAYLESALADVDGYTVIC